MAIFVGGLLAGGTLTAAVILTLAGVVGSLPDVARSVTVGLLAVVAVARELRVLRFRLPAPTRQVPETVFAQGPRWSALQFGFELGTGVRTQIPAAAPYVLAAVLLLLNPGPLTTLATGAAFGAGRAMMPLLRLAASDQARWDNSLRQRHRQVVVMGTSLTALAAAALVLSI